MASMTAAQLTSRASLSSSSPPSVFEQYSLNTLPQLVPTTSCLSLLFISVLVCVKAVPLERCVIYGNTQPNFNMGFLGLKYRRPAKQPVGRSLRCQDSEESLYSQYSEADSTYSLSSIPDALTFDRIIEGGTCPVSTSSAPIYGHEHRLTSFAYSLVQCATS